jgi:hypothetical protein
MKGMPIPLREASLSGPEWESIAAFRIAAADIHRHWWPYRRHQFRANIFNQLEGESASLIPHGDFTALSVAVRPVTLAKEPENFERVVTTLAPIAGPAYSGALQQLQQAWQEVHSGAPDIVFSTQEGNYDVRGATEIWFYGSSLHRHAKHRPGVETLKSFDPVVSMFVQHAVMRMASIAIALGSVLALMDGREPLSLAGETGPDLPDTLFAGAP